MKRLNLLFFLVILTIGCVQTTDGQLFQIIKNNKMGFINANGQVVIKPVFWVVGEFSEGLAAARINGTYGYIDTTGNFVIQPEFDYATPFSEGLAIVYKDARPFFINKQGQKSFEINFPVIEQFENGRAKVRTTTGKFGFINKKGKLIIDTIFNKIKLFVKGMAVVEGINHYPYADDEITYEVGVIDTLGKFIVPYGKYEEISDFANGYFKIEIPAEPWDTIEGSTKQTGFLDECGNLIFSRSHNNHSWIDGDIHCGLAKINLYKYCKYEEGGVTYYVNINYEGFINLKGEIVVNDTSYIYANDFYENRAFVRNKDSDFFIINTEGKLVSRDTFSGIAGEGFKNGFAFVEKNGKYGMIDTNANFIIKPQFEGIAEIGMLDGYFFFYDLNKGKNNSYNRLYGIAKKDGNILLNPIMEEFDRSGFRNGLLKCIVKGKLTYINKKGKIIWQEAKYRFRQRTNLNIDFMNRGYFYAYSTPNEEDIGGFGRSNNFPKEIPKKNNFAPKTISVGVRPDIGNKIFGKYKAATVFVANTSKNKIDFNAQDSRLYMKVQALNLNGKWKDIEYLPSSWCGNSYHTLTLEPNHYWTFLTPVYEGDFKTKLRIALKYIDPDKSEICWDNKETTIYSNEYEGNINTGQFWRKEDYYPNGIMDPYND